MKKIGILLFAMAWALVGFAMALQWGFRNPYVVVCDLIREKIFLSDSEMQSWNEICQRRSQLVTPFSSKSLIMQDLNNIFELLKVSHLEIYDALKVQALWEGQNLETGIESEFVDSELVIFKVHPNSPASRLGVKKGDIIKTINAEQPSPWRAQSSAGIFQIQRAGGILELEIKSELIQRFEEVQFEKLNARTGLVTVPSFRASFFEKNKIEDLQKQILGLNKVIVDLRGNIGGNFVAGLRFLSLFFCEPKEIGRLIKPRSSQVSIGVLADDLKDENQLAILGRHREVLLKTFSQNDCFRGDVRVLVDGKTASVAEMVAQALKELRKSPIVGQPSRGQLLVGVWYPVPELGEGVQVSIPEALYESQKKHRLEAAGVELDQVYYYDLREMQSGVDSWVRKALD